MKSFFIGPNKEKNGKSVLTYGFTYSELRDLDEAMSELQCYYDDVLSNDDPQFRDEQMGRLGSLAMKIDMYRGRALRNMEEEE